MTRRQATEACFSCLNRPQLVLKGFPSSTLNLIKIILEELEKSNQWTNEHPEEVAKILSKELGILEKPLLETTKRRKYGLQKIDQHVIQVQQDLADTFYQLKLFPRKVDVISSVEQNPKWLPANFEK